MEVSHWGFVKILRHSFAPTSTVLIYIRQEHTRSNPKLAESLSNGHKRLQDNFPSWENAKMFWGSGVMTGLWNRCNHIRLKCVLHSCLTQTFNDAKNHCVHCGQAMSKDLNQTEQEFFSLFSWIHLANKIILDPLWDLSLIPTTRCCPPLLTLYSLKVLWHVSWLFFFIATWLMRKVTQSH